MTEPSTSASTPEPAHDARLGVLAELVPVEVGHRRRALLTLLRHVAAAQEQPS